MQHRAIAQRLLAFAGITCNGANEWDIQVHDDRFYRRALLEGSVGFGESYMDGWWTCARMDLCIERILRSGLADWVPQFDEIKMKLRNLFRDRQSKEGSLRVAREHYDLSPDFFINILGDTNSYTCGRWPGVSTLDAAQVQKMDQLCRKLVLRQGQTVLDIGCGWGGFAGYAATKYGVNGIGQSISSVQLEYARSRYGDLPIKFLDQDYRDFRGKADAAVSICMIEHIGPAHYVEYFQRVRDALPKDGLFALQCIIAHRKRDMSSAWSDKYIFPGGMLVTLKNLRKSIRGIFHILDEEYFGEDYVLTLRAWLNNLRINKDAIVRKYGIEHYRKYEFYFLSFIGSFLSERITVGQFVLSATPRPGYVPIRL
ncbi:MAG: class I SAM-dependent methyltransferase [Minisyncoccia bacterium]